MAYTYLEGEKKTRPGVYHRTSLNGTGGVVGAINGVVAFVMNASWGPVDKVTKHDTANSIRETYGTGDGVEAACAILEAGAEVVYIKRLSGASGTAGTVGTDDIGTVVKLDAKYPSSRTIVVNVKAKVGDSKKKQVVITEGTTLLESFEFAVHATDETGAFLEAVADSNYIKATKLTTGLISVGEYTLTGKNPVSTASDYADALYALEPFRYNVLATDSIESDVFSITCAYVEESYENGKLIMAVVGDKTSTALTSRMEKAAACNSERVVYFGGSWVDSNGNTVEGAKAIAHIAGVIASTPANKSIVHHIISGATDVPEKLTNAQYVEAIKNGLLLTSISQDGQVWIDSGINTLVNLADTQDAGWKKIRRVKTRYELMDRIDRTLSPKVGKVNCDTDGIAFLIQSATGVIKEMVAEGKLYSGNFYEDPENPYKGDSAWFIIECDDIDSLEKIYLHYRFRYSAE